MADTKKTLKKSKTDKKERNERNDHKSREDENMNIDLEKVKSIIVFDAIQSPLCLVPPLSSLQWIWKNLGLWENFQQKNFM